MFVRALNTCLVTENTDTYKQGNSSRTFIIFGFNSYDMRERYLLSIYILTYKDYSTFSFTGYINVSLSIFYLKLITILVVAHVDGKQ